MWSLIKTKISTSYLRTFYFNPYHQFKEDHKLMDKNAMVFSNVLKRPTSQPETNLDEEFRRTAALFG